MIWRRVSGDQRDLSPIVMSEMTVASSDELASKVISHLNESLSCRYLTWRTVQRRFDDLLPHCQCKLDPGSVNHSLPFILPNMIQTAESQPGAHAYSLIRDKRC